MSTQKDREEFIARFVAEYATRERPKTHKARHAARTVFDCLLAARALLRLARTHGNLAVLQCNGCWVHSVPDAQIQLGATYEAARERRAQIVTEWEARLERKQAACNEKIRAICAEYHLPVTLGGDPRGCTVKVKLPSGAYNTWGGAEDGYGVPQ